MRHIISLLIILGFSASQMEAQNFYQPSTVTGGWTGTAWKNALSVAGYYPKIDAVKVDASGYSTNNAVESNSIKHYVQLRVDLKNENTQVLNKRFKVETNVDITFPDNTAANCGGSPCTNISLAVEYDPAATTTFKDREVFLVPMPAGVNSYKMNLKLNSAKVFKWNGTAYVEMLAGDPDFTTANNYVSWYLDGWIEMEKYRMMPPIPSAPNISAATISNNQLTLTWNSLLQAVEYDIEWIYIDDYGNTNLSTFIPSSQLVYNFKKNANRIRVPNVTTYSIPCVFEHGYLAFRVRAVGRNGSFLDDLSKPVFTNWSISIALSTGLVSSLAETGTNIQVIKILSPNVHQQDVMNWQMVTSYFEDGKRKDVVSYFDGTMRGRQSVTKTYEDNAAIVSDQLYDFEGRPSVQLMPTPLDASALVFYPNLNGTVTAQFNRTTFNNFSGCSLSPNPIVNNTGVLQGPGQYYSSANFSSNSLLPSAAVGYLPDAEGYPYSQVEYTKDNTGRIRRQGGAGSNHKIGSGHETKYYYSAPFQQELDRLFGGEVGDANHYKKNMVIDANGQSSFSYLDLKGNVIATALVGNAPTGLDTVREILALPITEDLLDFSSVDSINHALIAQKTLLVPTAGPYNFSYSVTPATFSTNYCNEAAPAPCYDCVYELSIRITRDEDCPSASGCPGSLPNISQTINNPYNNIPKPPVVDFTCSSTLQTVNVGSFTLQPGSYTVTKILKVSDSGLDAYMTDFLKNKCNEYNYFLNQEMSEIDTTACDVICGDCQDELNAIPDPNNISNTLLESLQNCIDASACDTTKRDMCEIAYEMMLDDVSPGGQYAEFQPDTISLGVEIALNAAGYRLSLLNATNSNRVPPYIASYPATWLPTIGVYSNPNLVYKDEDGTVSVIVIDGVTKSANQLTLREFMDNWQPSWAKTLVKLHPEYPQYQWCIDKALAGYNYDESMNQATTMALARSTWVGENIVFAPAKDPYFNTPSNPALGTGRIAKLLIAFNHQFKQTITPPCGTNGQFLFPFGGVITTEKCNPVIDTAYINKYLKRAAVAIVHCSNGNPTGCASITSNVNADFISGTVDQVQQNRKWQLYRAFYRSLKSEVMYFERTEASLANNSTTGNSYNGCIGVAPDGFTKAVNAFNNNNTLNQPCHCGSLGSIPIALPTDNAFRFRNKRRVFPALDDIPGIADENIYETAGGLKGIFDKLKLKMNDILDDYLCGLCGIVPSTITLPPLEEGFNSNIFSKIDCENPIKIYDLKTFGITDSAVLNDWQPMVVNICDTSNVFFVGKDTLSASIGVYSNCIIAKPAISNTTGLPVTWQNVQKICCATPLDTNKVVLHKAYGFYDPSKLYYSITATIADPTSPSFSYTENFEMSVPGIALPAVTGTFCTPLADSCNWPGLGSSQYVNFTLYEETTVGGISSRITKILYPNTTTQSLCEECADDPEPFYNSCKDELKAQAQYNANYRYKVYVDSINAEVRNMYYAKCMKAVETFNVSYSYALYHHTLYYYDQANNLVKTVPPNGIDYFLYGQSPAAVTQLQAIRNNRKTNHYPNPITTSTYKPNHKYVTFYRYNTINQPVSQESPDGGLTKFVYDEMRRLIRSQNANQAPTRYSYTKYDPLNRVNEVGEAESSEILSFASAMTYSSFLSQLGTYTTGHAESQITRTFYDKSFSTTTNGYFGTAGQENLRGRVSCVRFSPATYATFEQMTHYSYDVHGNVKTLIQDHTTFGQKRMDYTYDLISGNVKAFFYQKGQWDQYVHYYKYDKDNRLKKVETAQFPSIHPEMRDVDAEYFYYLHGPLARVELGDLKVQGVDYAYTIDGWLKGINGGTLASPTGDIGKDGNPNPANQNRWVARDAFGFVLGYYNNDYKRISLSALNFDNTNSTILFPTNGVQLFNGNIPQMVTSTRVPDSTGYRGQLCSYKYDQLHRLKGQTSTLMNGTMTSWPAPSVAANHYWMDLTYDYAGNIKSLTRQGANPTATRLMDQLTYQYTDAAKPNRLRYVDDAQTDAARYTDDIDDQSAGNYTYDKIGNMTGDASEGNKIITWNVYNKITQVAITTPSVTMAFGYDAMGNRVRKTVTKSGTTTDQWYIRDAQGNTLAVYKKVGTAAIQQDAVYLYGASRLGELSVKRVQPTTWDNRYARFKGNRHYELTNHLGNVLSVVTDRKLARDTTADANYAPQYYLPDVYMVENYYAFGQPLPKWNSKAADAPLYDPTKYRFGFNGKEDDDEWSKQDYGFRIYDGRIGRFLSVDPLTSFYPELTPYQFAGNMPIWAIDLDGLEPVTTTEEQANLTVGETRSAPLQDESGNYPNFDKSYTWQYNGNGSWGYLLPDAEAVSTSLANAAVGNPDKGSTPAIALKAGKTVAGFLGEDRGQGKIIGILEFSGASSYFEATYGKDLHGKELSGWERGMAFVDIIPGAGKVDDAAEASTGFAKWFNKVKEFEVGEFNDLSKRSKLDKLDVHHLPQKHAAAQVIPNYDPLTAPSMAVPTSLHKTIPNKKGPFSGNPRTLLATDAANARNAGIPNDAILENIKLAKDKYPILTIKPK